MTFMSIEPILTKLISDKSLMLFEVPPLRPGMTPRRRAFLAIEAARWTYDAARLIKALPHGTPAQIFPAVASSPAAVQAVLSRYVYNMNVSICRGRRASCDLKGLDVTGLHMPELFEIRSTPPDAVRLFGFVPAPKVLVLTHGQTRQ